MDPTLALTLGGAGLFGLGALVSTWRSRLGAVNHSRDMAEERGLGPREVSQLEHLGRYADHATLADLLLSPIRYDRAAAAYVDDLRRQGHPEAQYFGIIVELTRLRRRVHPPGQLLRWLVSTRELPEAAELTLSCGAWTATAVVWSVNEDHYDLRIAGHAVAAWVEPGVELAARLSLPGHGVYTFSTVVRTVATQPKLLLRLEHTDALERDNRRQFVRETTATPVLITPEDVAEPIEATLRDLSGGGVSFFVDTPLERDTRVRFLLPLGQSDEPPLIVWASVVRCDPDDGAYRVQGRWHGVTSDQRESIVRFVFDLQRQRVRRAKAAARLDAAAGQRALVLVPETSPR